MAVCLKNLKEAVKEVMSPEEAEAVFKEINETAVRRARLKKTRLSDELDQTKRELLDRKEEILKERERQAAANVIIRNDSMKFITSFKDLAKGLKALVVGVNALVKDSMRSLDATMKSWRADVYSRLTTRLNKDNVFAAFEDKNNDVELAKELSEQGSSKDPDVRKVGSIIRTLFNEMGELLNKFGANIKFRPDFISHQTHNVERMLQTADTFKGRIQIRKDAFKQFGRDFKGMRKHLDNIAFKRWKNRIIPLLDHERTFEGADPEPVLRQAYDQIVKGLNQRLDTEEEDILKFTGPGNLAKKISERRFFIFRDGESWAQYNGDYGSGTVKKAIMETLERDANNIAVLRKLGTNPDAMYESLKREIIERSDDPRIRRKVKSVDKFYKAAIGQDRVIVNNLLAKISANARAQQTLSKLGSILLASFPDLATNAAAMRNNGETALSAYQNALGFLFKGKLTPEKKQIADALGAWAEGTAHSLNSRFMPGDSAAGFMSKGMSLFFKYTGMEWFDKSQRTGLSMYFSRRLAQFRDVSHKNLNKGLKEQLSLYGINEKEWTLITENRDAMRSADREMFVTPDGTDEYTDESIAKFLGKDPRRLTTSQAEDVKIDMRERIRTYIIDQTDFGNLQPSAAERGLLLQGTEAGTPVGELLRAVAQFKYFPVAFGRRILSKQILGHTDDTIAGSLLNGEANIRLLVETIIATTALGYISNTAKDFARGLTPRDPTDPSTWVEALITGGGGGIYVDWLSGKYNSYGGGLVRTISGPLIGTAEDVAKMLATLRDGDDPTKMGLALTKGNLPMIRLWYTKAGIDYLLLYRLQEMVAPGSVQRMVDRVQRDNDQQFIVNPVPQ